MSDGDESRDSATGVGPDDSLPSDSEETAGSERQMEKPGGPSAGDETGQPTGPAVDTATETGTDPAEHTNDAVAGGTTDGGQPARGSQNSTFDSRVDGALQAISDGERRIDPGVLLEYTTDRRDLDPSVQYQWGLWTAIVAGVLTAFVTGLISAAGAPVVLGGVALVVLFGLGAGWVTLRYRRWVYQVREDSLYLERGVLVHRRTHLPYVRIQHVDTSRGPVERWLGLSTLVVYTAGSRGADVSVPGLKPEEASDLQGRVKRLAIEAEGGDAL
jgi:membrane protein YdbS with pleckstrin-like domain